MKKQTALALVAFVAAADLARANAFDESKYQIPKLEVCDAHVTMDLGAGCGWVWAEIETVFGIDGDLEGPILAGDAYAGAVLRQDLGSVDLVVAMTAATEYRPEPWMDHYSQVFGVAEFYVRAGNDDGLVSFGRQPTIANFYDDTARATLNPLQPITANSGLGYELRGYVGGNGAQLYVGSPTGWSGGLALEALGKSDWGVSPYWYREEQGTLVGVLNYVGEGLTAHSTLLLGGVFGPHDNQHLFTHSGVSVDQGPVLATAAAMTDYAYNTGDFYVDWLASIRADLAPFGATLTATRDDAEYGAAYEIAGIVDIQLGEAISLGAMYKYGSDEDGLYPYTEVGAYSEFWPAEELGLSAAAAHVSDDYSDLIYGQLTFIWEPTDTVRLWGNAVATDEGAYKLELQGQQRFN